MCMWRGVAISSAVAVLVGCGSSAATVPTDPAVLAVGDGVVCSVRPDRDIVSCWGGAYGVRPVVVGGVEASGVAVGRGFACGLDMDDGVQCWGASRGEPVAVPFADGAPSRVEGLSGVAQVVAGDAFACARATSGQVWCWGAGAVAGPDGAAGPAPVASLSGVVALAAAGDHACAVGAEGEVRCWGGQFGDAPVPPLPELDGRGGLTLSRTFGCATDTAGIARCFGDVGGLDGVDLSVYARLAAGTDHLCGLTAAGEVACWGENTWGQLGAGDAPGGADPRSVGLTEVAWLAAGDRSTCAQERAGALWCWGDNRDGQVGDGAGTGLTVNRYPTDVTGVDAVTGVAAGARHTCAVGGGGKVWCWGEAARGALGIGAAGVAVVATPREVAGVDEVVELRAAGDQTCARRAGSEVWCWGQREGGEPQLVPEEVEALRGAAAIAVTRADVCGLLDGRLRCLSTAGAGLGGDKLAGGGAGVCVAGPGTQVSCVEDGGPAVVRLSGPISELAFNGETGCAVVAGGLQCWGANERFQAATSAGAWLDEPVLVRGLAGLVDVALGPAHGCAVDRDGAAWCWGDRGAWRGGATKSERRNDCDEGDGCWAPFRAVPAKVSRISEATGVATGEAHTCVVASSGRARCWGDNSSGQLGNGQTAAQSTPTRVTRR